MCKALAKSSDKVCEFGALGEKPQMFIQVEVYS
jgi:hypothetical protein